MKKKNRKFMTNVSKYNYWNDSFYKNNSARIHIL